MTARRPLAGALAAVLALAGAARADVVTAVDGTVYEGKVVSQDEASVTIETTFDGTKTLARADVRAVDTKVPPLREQLAFRVKDAGADAGRLWEVHRWAKEKGFGPELTPILEAIVAAHPDDKKARKLLGHEKVDGRWMTPDEKARWLEEKHAEEMRAKGLVLHDGRWITPEEKEAIEKGLVKDGDDWVTEEEFHRRRGEVKEGDRWVRVGEDAAREWGQAAAQASGIRLEHLWGPHFDVFHDGVPEVAKQVLDAAEKGFAATRRILRPTAADLPETPQARMRIVLFKKQPAYVRFSKWFAEQEKTEELVPGWARMVQKQHAWWWTEPAWVDAVYQFPNPDKTFVSNAMHNVGLLLLTRYRLNFQFPSEWLREGWSYVLELEALGYTESFTLGRGPATPGATGQAGAPGAEGEPPAWNDSARWKDALKRLVAEGRDPPLKRLAAMTGDQMGYEELVKAWSVVDFLLKWDAARFKAFVDGTKKRGTEEEAALREAYGAGWLEVDRRWRAWVSGGFGSP